MDLLQSCRVADAVHQQIDVEYQSDAFASINDMFVSVSQQARMNTIIKIIGSSGGLRGFVRSGSGRRVPDGSSSMYLCVLNEQRGFFSCSFAGLHAPGKDRERVDSAYYQQMDPTVIQKELLRVTVESLSIEFHPHCTFKDVLHIARLINKALLHGNFRHGGIMMEGKGDDSQKPCV